MKKKTKSKLVMQDQNKNMDLLINRHRTAISLEPTNQKKKNEA